MQNSTTFSRKKKENRLALLQEKRRRREAGERLQLSALAETHLHQFARQAWEIIEPNTPLIWGRHMDALCEHLQAISRRQIANLLIEVPPGCSKSTLCSVFWPAWHWIRHPADRFLTASYALSLAIRDAVRSRRVISSPWYQEVWGDRFVLAGDQNVKSRYENDRTGYRVSVSVGSATTGERAHFTLIDDPHNVREVESHTIRSGILQWHDEAFFNRINNAKLGGRVVLGQRVHVKDLIGHLKSQDGWVSLTIPEEFEASNRCRTPLWSDWRSLEGELMRPERFGPEQVTEAKRRLGAYAYAAQHQQRPVPREGAIFKRHWWIRYHWLHDHYGLVGTGAQIFPHCCKRIVIMDPAGGTSESADRTAIAVWDISTDRKALLRHAFRERVSIEEIPRKLKEICDIYRPLYCLIEGAFLQSQIVRECRKMAGMPAIKSVDPGGKNKLMRAVAAIVKAEAGELLIPADNEPGFHWLEDWLVEHDQFTGNDDLHDDQVDCTAYMALEMQSSAAMGGLPMSLGQRGQ